MSETKHDRRRAAYVYGLRAETAATLWLRARRYQILARNFRAHGGEIDIIAKRGRTIVFVEVKARGLIDDAATCYPPSRVYARAGAGGWARPLPNPPPLRGRGSPTRVPAMKPHNLRR
ncbi:MAG: YraN family protein [Methylocystis sp.]